ncbi:MAG: HlyC/CorC family transporter [Candidatus Omnitrophota bacterium]|nr:MAG: HlyC/CorC family transporter [Candidatus Omnitrophota bacterium]
MGFNITLLIIFILFSAFFSGSETAIFSLSNVKLRRLQERYPQAKRIRNLLRRPTRLLSTIVFGNMLVNVGISSFSTAVFVSVFGQEGVVFAILFSTTFILFLGEIFPKTAAIYAAERISLFAAGSLDFFSKIFSPLISLTEKIVRFFSSFLIRSSHKAPLSDEELRTALLLGRRAGEITEAEEEMISYVLEFKDTKASEILTARIDIKGIDVELSQSEAVQFLRETKHSKLPVYKESLDNIMGVLYAKDVFLNPKSDYHKLIREPLFVPASKRIDDIIKIFLEKNERIAIVLDEYGGTEGLITLEDIEEEIFGEMYDEFETPIEAIEEIEKRSWRVYGKTPLKTVNLELELNLPEEEDNVAGFLLSQMEKIPRPQEKFHFGNVEFTVERATAKRIVSVIIKVRR